MSRTNGVLTVALLFLVVAVATSTYIVHKQTREIADLFHGRGDRLGDIETSLEEISQTTRVLLRKIAEADARIAALERGRTTPPSLADATREPPPVNTAPGDDENESVDIHDGIVVETFPGGLLAHEHLTSAERAWFRDHPPSDDAILIRGDDGKVGVLHLAGEETYIRPTGENRELVEALSIELLEHDRERARLIAEATERGEMMHFDTRGEAQARARDLGAAGILHHDADGYHVLDTTTIDETLAPRISIIEALKTDVGVESHSLIFFSVE